MWNVHSGQASPIRKKAPTIYHHHFRDKKCRRGGAVASGLDSDLFLMYLNPSAFFCCKAIMLESVEKVYQSQGPSESVVRISKWRACLSRNPRSGKPSLTRNLNDVFYFVSVKVLMYMRSARN